MTKSESKEGDRFINSCIHVYCLVSGDIMGALRQHFILWLGVWRDQHRDQDKFPWRCGMS